MAIEFEHLHVEVKNGRVFLTQRSFNSGDEGDVVAVPIEQFRCLLLALAKEIDDYKSKHQNDSDVVR